MDKDNDWDVGLDPPSLRAYDVVDIIKFYQLSDMSPEEVITDFSMRSDARYLKEQYLTDKGPKTLFVIILCSLDIELDIGDLCRRTGEDTEAVICQLAADDQNDLEDLFEDIYDLPEDKPQEDDPDDDLIIEVGYPDPPPSETEVQDVPKSLGSEGLNELSVEETKESGSVAFSLKGKEQMVEEVQDIFPSLKTEYPIFGGTVLKPILSKRDRSEQQRRKSFVDYTKHGKPMGGFSEEVELHLAGIPVPGITRHKANVRVIK